MTTLSLLFSDGRTWEANVEQLARLPYFEAYLTRWQTEGVTSHQIEEVSLETFQDIVAAANGQLARLDVLTRASHRVVEETQLYLNYYGLTTSQPDLTLSFCPNQTLQPFFRGYQVKYDRHATTTGTTTGQDAGFMMPSQHTDPEYTRAIISYQALRVHQIIPIALHYLRQDNRLFFRELYDHLAATVEMSLGRLHQQLYEELLHQMALEETPEDSPTVEELVDYLESQDIRTSSLSRIHPITETASGPIYHFLMKRGWTYHECGECLVRFLTHWPHWGLDETVALEELTHLVKGVNLGTASLLNRLIAQAAVWSVDGLTTAWKLLIIPGMQLYNQTKLERLVSDLVVQTDLAPEKTKICLDYLIPYLVKAYWQISPGVFGLLCQGLKSHSVNASLILKKLHQHGLRPQFEAGHYAVLNYESLIFCDQLYDLSSRYRDILREHRLSRSLSDPRLISYLMERKETQGVPPRKFQPYPGNLWLDEASGFLLIKIENKFYVTAKLVDEESYPLELSDDILMGEFHLWRRGGDEIDVDLTEHPTLGSILVHRASRFVLREDGEGDLKVLGRLEQGHLVPLTLFPGSRDQLFLDALELSI